MEMVTRDREQAELPERIEGVVSAQIQTSPTLSVVESVWNLPGSLLNYNLATLARQTVPPLEIVIVNASPDEKFFAEIEAVCAKYPLVRMIAAPKDTFNLSRNLNVGIRASQGEYVLLTACDQLFSPNLLGAVYPLLASRVVIGSMRADLPLNFDLGDADSLVDRWDDVVAQAIQPQKFSPGTIICVEKTWLDEVHGLDETRCPYNYCDSDLLTRAHVAGLRAFNLSWGDIQILHMSHPRNNELYYITSGMPDRSLPIIRNPNGWGQT